MKQRRFLIFIITLCFSNVYSQERSSTEYSKSKKFAQLLSEKNYKEAFNLLDSSLNQIHSAVTIGAMWYGLTEQCGKFAKIDSTWFENSHAHKICLQRILFEKDTLALKLSFTNGNITGVYIQPLEKDNYSLPHYNRNNFKEVDIILNSEKGISLPATLTIPNNVKKPPIVIFVHGSGPADRDESFLSLKPFKDLAVGLAAKGIASLRYEKRTLEYSDEMTLNMNEQTLYTETINDAVYALNYASTLKEINKDKIFVLGHSLGGMCGPKIGEMNIKTLKGVILLAGNARPMDVLLIEQLEKLSKQDSSDVKSEMMLNMVKYQAKILNSDTFSLKTKRLLLPLGLPTKYWMSAKQYNQAETAKKLNMPFLVLQGERDYQVTMKDFNIWKTVCLNPQSKFISYSKLNHCFIEGEGISTPAEYEKKSNIPYYVIDDISRWIKNIK